MRARFTPTLKQRLIALIASSTVAIVASLAIYFANTHVSDVSRLLRAKAASYANLVAKQVTSAVAFSDRETAREVMASVVTDPDVASARLFSSSGVALFTYGASVATPASTTTETDASITVVRPVISLEGPRGTLVLELSKQQIAETRNRLVRTAVGSGLVALLLAMLVAWLIARGVARRLDAIAVVATAVARGDLTREPVDDSRDDEIGVLASAFNAMLAQIKQLIARMTELSRQEQERLETLVAERTAELDARNTAMRVVFDHVDQGLVVVDLDGHIAREHSQAVERWLGAVPSSYQIVDFVRRFAPERAEWFAMMWGALQEDFLPLEANIAQLPAHFEVGGRHLEWAYQPFITSAGVTRILIKISDATAAVHRASEERDERELTSLLTRMLRDRVGLVANIDETSRLVAQIANPTTAAVALSRAVHTLKGMTAQLGLPSMAELCHRFETDHDEKDQKAVEDGRASVVSRWQQLVERIMPLLEDFDSRLDVTEQDLALLDTAIARGVSREELARIADGWRFERARSSLDRLRDQAQALAARLEKSVTVQIEVDKNLRLPAQWAPLWGAFGHAIRNSLDHGIETLEERSAVGKSPGGTLTLRAYGDHVALYLELADDGRGIDWQHVAAAARGRGLPTEDQRDLEAAMFSDGVSTRSDVTEISGRGIGMGALREACTQCGGQLSMLTSGSGTTMRFTWPLAGRSKRPSALIRASSSSIPLSSE